ncbi:oxidoreductase [Mucilaginibacter robiniae]|uniref:Oxidoreductase n=1 Tax=Mucilaginibacter robiniae TaxID=2728022 RepID=A0A7L5E4A1_9SPHI|nr:YCF48-related protein [Mucilaginibacter robiniae]QJD95176.1 oxidoreductase [Mucilaginibacter robiniae]
MKHAFVWLILLLSMQLALAQSIRVVEQGQPCSIRGLSVVDDRVAWASGSKGHVAISTNGGQTWQWRQVKGFEQSDFRDIEAFSAREAIIMSSGTPAVILKTIDGGESWNVCYRNPDKAYFLDAMTFADPQHGYILGDPINGKFLLLQTINGGQSWAPFAVQPTAMPNEAAFAASGTCIRVNKNNLYVVTGGATARLLATPLNTAKWTYTNLPITHGQASTGAFSVAFGSRSAIIVGGNYASPKLTDSVACYISLPAVTQISLAKSVPAGYQSGVEYLGQETFLATGTSGTNWSTDNGQTWRQIDQESYNTCQKAKRGKLVLLAGDKGRIAILQQ